METPKRLTPTADTVRRLFLLCGNQCAFPGCSHPIVVEDGTYVGELCHICAAEEGGERFDPRQTNEERRGFDNLLLMCHDHHVFTNDTSEYPKERMLEIKSNHEQRFARGLASMMETSSVQIVNSTLSLGGEGGKAPGAGGGGGGAIGPGAVGGPGGGGGEIKEGFFEIDENVAALIVRVGRGGKGGVDGSPGENGEDSYIEVVNRDGTAKEVVRAKGGEGGDQDIGDARVLAAMLADAVELKDGLIYALKAGWKSYTVESLPAPMTFGVLFIADAVSAPRAVIKTCVFDSRNVLVASNMQEFDFSRGSVCWVVKVCCVLTEVGLWRVVLSCGQRDLWQQPFEVLLKA
jgi:hypothetical protein